MDLFEIKEGQVTFSPQALTLSPFAKLWERDKKKGKPVAIAEMAALYFYADYKSDFSEIYNPTEKLNIIKSVIVGMDDSWKPDKVFKEAVDFYKSRQETVSTILLGDARNAVDKISRFLRGINLNEEVNGRPKHDIKKIADTLGNLSRITESLQKLEEQVKKELQEEESMRGGHAKAIFEDGIT
jgi:hypothetical protein